jgi:hypothetical protein
MGYPNIDKLLKLLKKYSVSWELSWRHDTKCEVTKNQLKEIKRLETYVNPILHKEFLKIINKLYNL